MPDYLAVILAGLVAIGFMVSGYRLACRRDRADRSAADFGLSWPGHRDPDRMTQGQLQQEKGMASHQSAGHEEFPIESSDPVLRVLHWIMRAAAYVLAIAMVVVIVEGVISVIYQLYQALTSAPYFMVPDIVKTFGGFLAVLIAFEIFANITLYIRSDVFPVKLVIATALMAIARKIIVLDMSEYSALDLIGVAAVVIALGATYWLVSRIDQAPGIRASAPGDGC
ncbi:MULTISPECIES: phosphate-starvation-inducible PsiE family protein [Thiorhodovibrio]|uniref:phosphate-starvation-inducible PsiE family protein n=1 Tax=Thiorhodovibrio TaxID=61593 RepID=UPI001F5C7B01|nr:MULTISPECIES: phosphate-starvation-inducible PsiE family protein [Thiorhodovibrio]WPL10328.1 phosphate-starvation-inducible protein PsiE [Thiorhodovibrio litoralis]